LSDGGFGLNSKKTKDLRDSIRRERQCALELDLRVGWNGWIKVGDDIVVITWLLSPTGGFKGPSEGDLTRAEKRRFSTRSPHRPNQLAFNRAKVLAIGKISFPSADRSQLDGTLWWTQVRRNLSADD